LFLELLVTGKTDAGHVVQQVVMQGATEEVNYYDFKIMMQNYLKEENMMGEDAYYCKNCKGKSKLAIKTIKFLTLPPVLIVNFLRFTNQNIKILDPVLLEEKIQIRNIFNQEDFTGYKN